MARESWMPASGDGEGLPYWPEDGEPSRTGGVDAADGRDGTFNPTSGSRDPSFRVTENGINVSVCAGELEQVATRLLTSYRDAQDCVLASSGYLDLLGLVWGCVIQGDGWVDVCIVAQGEEEGTCKVSVLHMGASELSETFGGDEDL